VTIIDIHTHYAKWPFPIAQVSPDEIVRNLSSYGIGRAIVSSVVAILYDFREGNWTLAQAIAPYPELLGYVTINLNYVEESLRELDTYSSQSKFVGAKIHPLYCRQKVNSPNGQRLLRALAERNCPLLLHTYSSPLESPWNAVPIAKANPHLPIIMAHMGGDAWLEGIAAAKESANLHVDFCATWADADKVAWVVRELGAERVLFGSDYTLFEPAHTLGMIDEAAISAEEKALILYGNAERLFKIMPDE
jgi:predicted TIM-barrel fold metal-dependent hydrolase